MFLCLSVFPGTVHSQQSTTGVCADISGCCALKLCVHFYIYIYMINIPLNLKDFCVFLAVSVLTFGPNVFSSAHNWALEI